MAKGKEDRISFVLKCQECGEENYLTSKNKKKHPDRLELNKYCPRCKKVTVHKEKKKQAKPIFLLHSMVKVIPFYYDDDDDLFANTYVVIDDRNQCIVIDPSKDYPGIVLPTPGFFS